MQLKKCTNCRIEKSLYEFSKDITRSSGIQCWCKECVKNYKKVHYNKNRLEILFKQKKYTKLNKNRIKKYKSKYYQKYKKLINNKQINRRKTDICFKVTHNLRMRVVNSLKGNSKSLPTMFLLGCEIDYLMYRLQEQFTKGMSWDNYGDWEVDHIKPCASFDLAVPKQQKQCFNYLNLQPLWKKKNQEKGDKYE